MNKNIWVPLLIIIAFVVLGALIYYTMQYDQPSQETPPPPVAQHETINAKHQYKDGRHIIAGEANVPTPCHILTTDALVAESMPEQVTVRFAASSSADVCAQVLTPARFKVEFQASEKATIRVTWNGDPVELNLIPAGADENLDDFELFIKG
ncbi:MAG: hypothetical protein AAB367_04615 [Patescibacteria group bacterium]